MKIGIIQTRGLGDIVIAAPIAMYYIERGCEVYWPIDSEFIHSFKDAFPKIKFIAIDKSITGDATTEFFYHVPLEELNKKGCESIICLYSYLSGFDLGHKRLQESLPFDAYKYAVANVPFMEKWNFNPKRNPIREANLFTNLQLDPNEPYIVIQDQGSNFNANLDDIISENQLRIVKVTPITNNIFDWLGVFECSKSIYAVDSVYVNIIEQLKFKNDKHIYLRSTCQFTPTLISNWSYH